jgi:hypothetical protein
LTTPPSAFSLWNQPDGSLVDTVTDGSGTVTLSNPDGSPAGFLIPDITHGHLQLIDDALRFIHGYR